MIIINISYIYLFSACSIISIFERPNACLKLAIVHCKNVKFKKHSKYLSVSGHYSENISKG